jgi:serine/threonine-protein phosphatase 2A regulatory subunit A
VPVNVLIDELKSDEIRKRINSLQNLHVIAQALGTARTRSELLPFLGGQLDFYFDFRWDRGL